MNYKGKETKKRAFKVNLFFDSVDLKKKLDETNSKTPYKYDVIVDDMNERVPEP